MTILALCTALGFLGLFLGGVGVFVIALRRPTPQLNRDLFQK